MLLGRYQDAIRTLSGRYQEVIRRLSGGYEDGMMTLRGGYEKAIRRLSGGDEEVVITLPERYQEGIRRVSGRGISAAPAEPATRTGSTTWNCYNNSLQCKRFATPAEATRCEETESEQGQYGSDTRTLRGGHEDVMSEL